MILCRGQVPFGDRNLVLVRGLCLKTGAEKDTCIEVEHSVVRMIEKRIDLQ
jgi:hypothetical protein